MPININNPARSPHAVLNLGFRIFFLSAAAFAFLTMAMWYFLLTGRWGYVAPIQPFYWHGHEMLFGYTLAVIAGFLLTAVRAWTGVPMPIGWRLFAIFLPWFVARVLWAMLPADTSGGLMMAALVFDGLFWLSVVAVITRAVLLARQKRQIGIVAKLLLLFICQLIFAIGVLTDTPAYQKFALYAALFLIVGVVLTIGRRVLPFFIEKASMVDKSGKPLQGSQAVKLPNSQALDKASLFGFFALMVVYLAYPKPVWVSLFASFVAIINAVRLWRWHHHSIWQKPLMWSLYLSFWGVVLSLFIVALLPWTSLNPSLGIHALALTAIGMTTVAMMARVSLGHTGRNIHKPPKAFVWIFALMVAGFILRVIMPMFGGDYLGWIAASQLFWVGCFGLFLCVYAKILTSPRSDGLTG